MKSTFIIYATALIIISCTSSNRAKEIDYSGFNEKVIYLMEQDSIYTYKDSLATVFIKIPERLDTFYHWIDFSDYTGGQFMYYRFGDKKYSEYNNCSGCYNSMEFPDSLYQLSIRYKPFKEIPDSIMKRIKIDTNEIGFKMPHPNFFNGWIKREVKNINERSFIILAYHDETWIGKNIPFKIVMKACTYFDNRMLEFVGECDAKDTTGFIDNMYKSFLSIRIKENP